MGIELLWGRDFSAPWPGLRELPFLDPVFFVALLLVVILPAALLSASLVAIRRTTRAKRALERVRRGDHPLDS